MPGTWIKKYLTTKTLIYITSKNFLLLPLIIQAK